jgi:hypothetical protein
VKPTLFLRIASVLTFVHCVLHTVGGVFGSPAHGAEEIAVIETMKSHHFDFLGSMRSYGDFFFGYGLHMTIILFFLAVLFWLLGSLAKTNAAPIRLVAAVFCLTFLFLSVVSWKYFFIAPVINELLIAVCLAVAFVQSRGGAASN